MMIITNENIPTRVRVSFDEKWGGGVKDTCSVISHEFTKTNYSKLFLIVLDMYINIWIHIILYPKCDSCRLTVRYRHLRL